MFGFVGLVCLISVEQEKMDKSAFEQKARTWREKAVSASLHYGAGREEAEDIAQDVMLRLWQMHDELERYQSVEAIVTIMARHQLRNHQRRKRGEAVLEQCPFVHPLRYLAFRLPESQCEEGGTLH